MKPPPAVPSLRLSRILGWGERGSKEGEALRPMMEALKGREGDDAATERHTHKPCVWGVVMRLCMSTCEEGERGRRRHGTGPRESGRRAHPDLSSGIPSAAKKREHFICRASLQALSPPSHFPDVHAHTPPPLTPSTATNNAVNILYNASGSHRHRSSAPLSPNRFLTAGEKPRASRSSCSGP